MMARGSGLTAPRQSTGMPTAPNEYVFRSDFLLHKYGIQKYNPLSTLSIFSQREAICDTIQFPFPSSYCRLSDVINISVYISSLPVELTTDWWSAEAKSKLWKNYCNSIKPSLSAVFQNRAANDLTTSRRKHSSSYSVRKKTFSLTATCDLGSLERKSSHFCVSSLIS